jgi:WD40 repeat protein
VTALAFAPDGRHLAAAAEDGSIGVYDLASAK